MILQYPIRRLSKYICMGLKARGLKDRSYMMTRRGKRKMTRRGWRKKRKMRSLHPNRAY
jgi:hypothetical protein